ncbi:MAG: prepilin-type N-terminal cleavage/methylation domain-containing protein, partial [Nitrospiria bacterium]
MGKLKFGNNLYHRTDGFTLLEMMIALVVFSVGILGVLGMVSKSIEGNSFASEISVATNLAKDKVEEMKNMVFDDLFQSSADPTTSTNAAPVDMTDIDPVAVDPVTGLPVTTVVTPVDDGVNA